MPRVVRRALAVLALATSLPGVAPGQQVSLLPAPAEVRAGTGGAFELESPVVIAVPPTQPELRDAAEWLAATLRSSTGLVVRVRTQGSRHAIVLDTLLASGNPEAYTLNVSGEGIRLSGATVDGVRRGLQTLLQLLPAPGERAAPLAIAAITIHDAPRLAWRGTMLDVARHFLTVAEVKRHLDLMARLKLNVLHWHLTDDQGWRVQIRRYPALTTVGAWRREPDGRRAGGAYTQAQVREVVAHARRLGIMVVPEIEMPGHATAALAAYPWLGCTGARLEVPATWGVFADVMCPGSGRTFAFLDAVLDEVMDLFPAPWVHLGGDEVPKDRWRACASCQSLMRREGLPDEEALQAWFMRRAARRVLARGRRVIGWDEVLEGGFVPGGVVQSWRDSAMTRRAILAGHDVIASPSEFTYLNRSAAELTAAQVAQFAPIPPGLDSNAARRVLGTEVPFWSERITSGTNLELMALPRLLAFAEVAWRGNGGDVEARIPAVASGLAGAAYAVGPDGADLATLRVTWDSATRRARLGVTTSVPGLVVRGARNGAPGAGSPAFADGAKLPSGTSVTLQAFVRGARVGEARPVRGIRHAAVGARVHTDPPADARYPGTGVSSLVDGLLGSVAHGDGLWQGWWGPDVTATVELVEPQRGGEVRVRFLQNQRSWILLPSRVEVSWSDDGATWSTPEVRGHAIPAMQEGVVMHEFTVAIPAGARVRQVRVTARNGGALPSGHPGAGQPSWLFADEIVVRRRPTS